MCFSDDSAGSGALSVDRTAAAEPAVPRDTPPQDQTGAAGATDPGAGVRVQPEPREPELLAEGAADLRVPDSR